MYQSAISTPIYDTLSDFRERVLALFPDGVEEIILFGSSARGEATPGSDLDVLVVVNGSDPGAPGRHYFANLTDPGWKAIIDAAIDVFIEQGPPYLSPLVIGKSLFETDLEVAANARTEGQVMWKNPGK